MMISRAIKYLTFLALFVYCISPIVFKHAIFIQRNLLFMNLINTRYDFNLSRPEEAGLKCTRTLSLTNKLDNSDSTNTNNVIHIGAWHIVAQSSLSACKTIPTTTTTTTSKNNNNNNNDEKTYERTTIDDLNAFSNDQRPIIIYAHGNGGNRGAQHRVSLYLKLAYEFDMHIVTFDYRGYGDSTYETPTAPGLVSDAQAVYNWLLKQKGVTKDRIRVWGHSLGTGVASQLVANLPDSLEPKKLVLEAPFNTLANAIANHPFAMPFKIIPYFEYFFVEPIQQSIELNFDSEKALKSIKNTQIIILHAQDDRIIPFKLGYTLYSKARDILGESNVKFIGINEDQNLGHKFICMHDNTMKAVNQFLE